MYRHLNLSGTRGHLEIQVPTPTGFSDWLPIIFSTDRRLVAANIHYHPTTKRNGTPGKPAPIGNLNGVKIAIRGISIRYKAPHPEPLLVFTVEYGIKPPKRDLTKPGLYISADLGIRTPAYCAAAYRKDKIAKFIQFTPIKVATGIRTATGTTSKPLNRPPSFYIQHTRTDTRSLQYHLSRIRHKTGGRLAPDHGRYRQDHKTNAVLDRARKTANSIIAFARHNMNKYPGVPCTIVVEDLKTLLPSLKNNRYFNNRLATMLNGKIRFYLESLAGHHGITVYDVPSHGTSRICGRCRHLGARFTRVGSKPKIDSCGPHFWCPNCGRQRNSDLNAAINLVKISIYRKYWTTYWAAYTSLDKNAKRAFRANIEHLLLAAV